MRHVLRALVVASAITSITHAQSVILMSPEWAQQACAAWNEQPALTEELGSSGWAENNKDRGYKVLHVYRKDCPDSPIVELRIEHREGKATCAYGGPVENQVLDTDADYLMYADTRRWQEMGAGRYGPMRAMMFRRLRFEGPKWEAMRNMGPFEQFLLLVGKVDSDLTECP
jgi:putative sterol carrier protein